MEFPLDHLNSFTSRRIGVPLTRWFCRYLWFRAVVSPHMLLLVGCLCEIGACIFLESIVNTGIHSFLRSSDEEPYIDREEADKLFQSFSTLWLPLSTSVWWFIHVIPVLALLLFSGVCYILAPVYAQIRGLQSSIDPFCELLFRFVHLYVVGKLVGAQLANFLVIHFVPCTPSASLLIDEMSVGSIIPGLECTLIFILQLKELKFVFHDCWTRRKSTNFLKEKAQHKDSQAIDSLSVDTPKKLCILPPRPPPPEYPPLPSNILLRWFFDSQTALETLACCFALLSLSTTSTWGFVHRFHEPHFTPSCPNGKFTLNVSTTQPLLMLDKQSLPLPSIFHPTLSCHDLSNSYSDKCPALSMGRQKTLAAFGLNSGTDWPNLFSSGQSTPPSWNLSWIGSHLPREALPRLPPYVQLLWWWFFLVGSVLLLYVHLLYLLRRLSAYYTNVHREKLKEIKNTLENDTISSEISKQLLRECKEHSYIAEEKRNRGLVWCAGVTGLFFAWALYCWCSCDAFFSPGKNVETELETTAQIASLRSLWFKDAVGLCMLFLAFDVMWTSYQGKKFHFSERSTPEKENERELRGPRLALPPPLPALDTTLCAQTSYIALLHMMFITIGLHLCLSISYGSSQIPVTVVFMNLAKRKLFLLFITCCKKLHLSILPLMKSQNNLSSQLGYDETVLFEQIADSFGTMTYEISQGYPLLFFCCILFPVMHCLVRLLLLSSSHFRVPILFPVRNVYADGVFDFCHFGHKNLMLRALSLPPAKMGVFHRGGGNQLFVGVCNDEECVKYKRLPIMTTAERVTEVKSCGIAAVVIPHTPARGVTEDILRYYRIHVCVCGEEYDKEDDKYYRVPRSLGILETIPRTLGLSTTDLIERAKNRFSEFSK